MTLNSKYPDHPNGEKNENALKESSEHGRHVVVASEPTTYKADEWNLIEKNTMVLVDDDGQVQLDAVDYASELNSTVNSL